MSLYSTFIASSSSTVPVGTPIYVLTNGTFNTGSKPDTLLGATYVKAGATYPIATYPELAAHIGVAWPAVNAVITQSTGAAWNIAGGMIYVAGMYVGAGANGEVRTSTDLITWTSRPTGSIQQWYAITYATQFVVCGTAGNIYTSTDTITWSARTSGTASVLYGIAYGNGYYVAVGNAGVCRRSTDAITWSAGGSVSSTGNAVIFDGTQFVAAINTASPSANIKTSTDAVTWTSRFAPIDIPSCLAYGNGYYVAGTTNGVVGVSTDAITWASYTAKTTVADVSSVNYNAAFGFVLGISSNAVVTALNPTAAWASTQITPGGAPTAVVITAAYAAVATDSSVNVQYTALYDTATTFYVPTGSYAVPALTGQTTSYTAAAMTLYVKAA